MYLPPMITDLMAAAEQENSAASIELVQTHISFVIIGDRTVYKIKKPVDFGFLDFSTLEKRAFYCKQELDLNRRLSPQIYLDVVEVKKREGKHFFGGPGETVDYAVKMKRIPEERMMLNLLKEGVIDRGVIALVAKVIARFHSQAAHNENIAEFGDPRMIARNMEENFSQTRKYIGRSLSQKQYDSIVKYTEGFMAKKKDLFLKRMAEGKIRDCHGDIHMEHVCITNRVYIYDCIEFNDRFRYSDVAADIAFLAMDLDYHHRSDLSKELVACYIAASGDEEIRPLINFYKCYRAYVRGKVDSFELDDSSLHEEELEAARKMAESYFELAGRYASKGLKGEILIITCGLMGVGKSTIAAAIAEKKGFQVLRSDEIRKEIAGIAGEERRHETFGEGIYSEDYFNKTYEALFKKAKRLLEKGEGVILDASFKKSPYRLQALELANGLDIPFLLVECICRDEEVKRRLEERVSEGSDISDGRWEIYEKQKKTFERIKEIPASEHIIIDTEEELERNIKNVLFNIEKKCDEYDRRHLIYI
ncbi:MAG: AAA family ATPase [Deltaproteobacteria bacterium]|nr:AAA family ATPase [Deltaproteobacteria bacterium]